MASIVDQMKKLAAAGPKGANVEVEVESEEAPSGGESKVFAKDLLRAIKASDVDGVARVLEAFRSTC